MPMTTYAVGIAPLDKPRIDQHIMQINVIPTEAACFLDS